MPVSYTHLFLHRRKIALWDMVTECEIEGSADSAVKNASVADLGVILRAAPIEKILLNGTLSYNLFTAHYALSLIHISRALVSPKNAAFRG